MDQATADIDRTVERPYAGSRRYAGSRYAGNGRGSPHPGTQGEQDALTSLLGQYFDAVKAAVRSRAELFSLEAQRAANSATRMAVLGGTLLIVGMTAWLLLVTTVVLGMAAAGMPLLLALVIVFALHLVVAFVTVGRMRKLADDFGFTATRRSLRDGIVKLRPHAHEGAQSAAGVPHMAVPGTPGDVAATRVAGAAPATAAAATAEPPAEVVHAQK